MSILLEALANFVAIFGALVAGYFALRKTYHFHPRLRVRIVERWTDKHHVVLQLRVTNRSRVRIGKTGGKSLLVLLQVIQRDYPPLHGQLSEWVPFTKEKVRDARDTKAIDGVVLRREEAEPVRGDFAGPMRVLETTTKFDPGEEVLIERLFHCPENTLLHAALQARIGNDSWTTTRITTPPHSLLAG